MARIQFLKPYRRFRIGQCVEIIDSLAEVLVQRGMACRTQSEPENAPEAMAEAAPENAMKRKSGRRRRTKEAQA